MKPSQVGTASGTARPRLEILDGLRFVAALAVVALHFTTIDHVWHRRVETIFPSQPFAYGWLGIYLFFLISGFVICMSSWGRAARAFLVSRAVRLYPAYWLSVVAGAVVVAVWPYVNRPVGWGGVAVNLTMFQEPLGVRSVAEVYWTLWAELRFYLLFLLMVWWGLTYRRVVAFCLVWLGISFVTRVFVPDGGVVHGVLMNVLMADHAPLFTAGIGCYLMHRFRPTPLTWAILFGSFVLSVPTALGRARQLADPRAPVPEWPAVVLLAVCFVLIAGVGLGCLSRVRGRWLVAIGGISYPLYLFHLNIGGTMLYLWQHNIPIPLLLVLVTGAMVLLGWLVHRYLERQVAPPMKRALLRMSARAVTDGRTADDLGSTHAIRDLDSPVRRR
jgi:peptidoglycan/LPS O-acetylase OafA/YrhL